MIHRDLKPENILLDKNYRGVVADFGIVKLVEKHEVMQHTAVGTISYMAPETYLHLPYDKSVDTWALGLMFYEMAMMKYPFSEMVSILKGFWHSNSLKYLFLGQSTHFKQKLGV